MAFCWFLGMLLFLAYVKFVRGCDAHHPIERQPQMSYEKCTRAEGCTRFQGTLTADASLRGAKYVHDTSVSCFKEGAWNKRLCSNAARCAKNCAPEGFADYDMVGVSSVAGGVRIRLVTEDKQAKTKKIGSRLYHLDSDGNYVLYKLQGKELSFEVDLSRLPCGVKGAMYFSEMAVDGGSKSFMGTNHSGAFFGSGYCDAQCSPELMYLGAEANVGLKRKSSKLKGHCCPEMALLEGNSFMQRFVPHPCATAEGPVICEDKQCGGSPDGLCDKSGCDFASYRLGDHGYYGPGKRVDTNFPFTVVTQFLIDSAGSLAEIRRLYVQNRTVIRNSRSEIGMIGFDSITEKFCTSSQSVVGENNVFKAVGGLKALGESLERGVVLGMSLWTDVSEGDMLWLDGVSPSNVSSGNLGLLHGPCTPSDGNTTMVEEKYPNAFVQFSNIRIGEIDTTYYPFAPQEALQ